MKRKFISATVMIALCTLLARAEWKEVVSIRQVGTFNETADFKEGDEWLGLMKDSSELRRVVLKVKTYDGPAEKQRIQEVSATSGTPSFLLKSPHGILKEGKIGISFISDLESSPEIQAGTTIEWKGIKNVLRVESYEVKGSKLKRLVLIQGADTVLLYDLHYLDVSLSLQFAGDLDGDGKLDLICTKGRPSDEDCEFLIFLSSLGRGRPVLAGRWIPFYLH